MLYDNIYSMGHIFQTFLQDVPEKLNHDRGGLASSEASYAGADATLSSRLLAWLDRQDIVMDVGHKATLLQIANAFEAPSSTCDTVQPLAMS
jgi:NADPH-dependent 7-cyano-7-deazaguanine reductase QueF-like protein